MAKWPNAEVCKTSIAGSNPAKCSRLFPEGRFECDFPVSMNLNQYAHWAEFYDLDPRNLHLDDLAVTIGMRWCL